MSVEINGYALARELEGAGIASMQTRFDEKFVVKEEVKPELEPEKKEKGSRKRISKKPSGKTSLATSKHGTKTKVAHKKKPVVKDQLD